VNRLRERKATEGRRPLQSINRDQGASVFTSILERVVAETRSARAAALFDYEGETVDYAGSLDPFQVRIIAAHCQIMLAELRDLTKVPAPKQLCIRAKGCAFVIRVLDDAYSLVVITHPRAPFAVSERVLRDAEVVLASEAGLSMRAGPKWRRVDVELEQGRRGSPVKVRPTPLGPEHAADWAGVLVLGAVVGLAARERGYRVRFDNGNEANLVCERSRLWFVDEHVS
jgi:hypothetical protein